MKSHLLRVTLLLPFYIFPKKRAKIPHHKLETQSLIKKLVFDETQAPVIKNLPNFNEGGRGGGQWSLLFKVFSAIIIPYLYL